MTISIGRAQREDLATVARLGADAQADAERYCAYFAEDAAAIASEVAAVVGPNGDDWSTATWTAVDDDDQLLGWLLAETDPDMSRVWWWGPTIAHSSLFAANDRDDTIDQLFAAALDALDGYREHEMAIDDRSTTLACAARRQGLTADPGSAILRTEAFETSTWEGYDDVIALAPSHHSSLIELHDELFAGTHTPGTKLVEAGDEKVRLVVESDVDSPDPSQRPIAGYVATEMQADGSLYIDYLGVSPEERGQGHGRRLVSEAMRLSAEAGASHAHLTVRADSTAARALYASLGFVHERIVVPFRRGFPVN